VQLGVKAVHSIERASLRSIILGVVIREFRRSQLSRLLRLLVGAVASKVLF